MLDECSQVLLQQSIFLADIYNWFNNYRQLSKDEIEIIKLYITKKNITSRDKVLLDNLIGETDKQENDIISFKSIQIDKVEPPKQLNDVFKLEITNLLEEYELVENYEDVEEFLKTRCLDMITKNKFGDCLISLYISTSSNKYLNLMSELVTSQKLYKTSISKAINTYKNSSKNLMKNLLKTCKKIGIVKDLDNLYNQYKI